MNEDSGMPAQTGRVEAPELPPWPDCDVFCIHHYAATGTSPCGWRGRWRDLQRRNTSDKLLCPRCGCATLLPIPPDRVK